MSQPSYEHLLYSVENRIATITLNRPDRYNALNNKLSYEIIDVFRQVNRDKDVRAVVLTGAGDKAFCSGQDLKDVAGVERSLGESVRNRYNPMARGIYNCEKPVICRLNGIAAGAGAGLALACDMVIASDTSSLLFAFVNIGLVPDTATSWILPRLVGRRKAYELMTLGEKISAQDALDLGMINRVVPVAELDTVVADLAASYASKAPKSLAMIKRLLHGSMESGLETILEQEMYGQEIAGKTKDYIEGVMAFAQKRKAEFTGE
jgi:2-(1,2-epoxy-1,2-dihydrophenyl)acetyl-CoA isomerase